MSFSINEWSVMGVSGLDAETRTSPKTGGTICTFSVAVTEFVADSPRVLWVPITLFSPLAERAARCVFKGTTVWARGRFQVSEWLDKRGNRRVSFGMVANDFRALTTRAAAQVPDPPPADEIPADEENR